MCIFIVIFRRAHKVWLLCVGEKKEEEAQKVCPKPEASKCVLVRKNRKSTHPLESLFSPLFSTAFVRSFAPQNWSVFFPFFAYFQACRTRNSSFLKHRIHPKHGSGRTSSLTRSNTRKCISSSFYFVFFSFVEFFFKQRAKLSSLFFLSV